MPRTSAKDLRSEKTEDLDKRVKELREELFNLRFKFAAGELSDTAKIAVTRRELARTLTVLREKKHV